MESLARWVVPRVVPQWGLWFCQDGEQRLAVSQAASLDTSELEISKGLWKDQIISLKVRRLPTPLLVTRVPCIKHPRAKQKRDQAMGNQLKTAEMG